MIWLGVLIVIAVLFLIFPQQMGGLLAVILVGIGITALIIFIDSYSTEKAEESVSIVASYVPASCSEDYPLHFKITNRSKKIVNKVEWNITATREGYSNNVVSYIFSGYDSEYATPFSHFHQTKYLNQTNFFQYAIWRLVPRRKLLPKILFGKLAISVLSFNKSACGK